MLFPFLAGATLFSRPRIACALAIIAMAGVATVALSPNSNESDIRYGPLDVFTANTLLPVARCFCEFTLGLLCFRLESRASALPDRTRGWLLAGIAICIPLLLAWPASDIILVPLFAALVILLARGANAVAHALASSIPFQLGVLSYSIYLLHGHMYEVRSMTEAALAIRLPPDLAHHLALAASYAGLLIAAWLAFAVVERPARKLIRKAEHLFVDFAQSPDARVGAPVFPPR